MIKNVLVNSLWLVVLFSVAVTYHD